MKVREGNNVHFKLAPAIPVLSGLLKAWSATVRTRTSGFSKIEPLLAGSSPAIIAFWHFGLIHIACYFRNLPASVVMISGSKDGEIAARIAQRWGHVPVRGSRMKHGLLALRQMKELMKKGLNAGIVVDGSQGPARIAQKGVIVLSRETGAPIIPVGIAANPVLRFNSWDRMILPLPGSKCVIVCADPITVPEGVRGPDIEPFRVDVEDALNSACDRAETILVKGH